MVSHSEYTEFLEHKTHRGIDFGFEPVWMPESLFPFQQSLVEWSLKKGRAAIFADCGMGKTLMQLTWAENVARKANGSVLILTPLAVAFQTVKEGEKIGVEVIHRRAEKKQGDRIVVTNYERLHHFNPTDFVGVVCDESSILKSFDGATRQKVTDFMRKTPYRLLCTATAAPNDYVELGTSSEALGVLERKHMLAQFFVHDGGDTSKWRVKGHARTKLFWQWVLTWAISLRQPSDVGFDNNGFILPPLVVNEHTVRATRHAEGFLFEMPAVTLQEQRDELRRTLNERCEKAADLITQHTNPAIAWCHLNGEGDLLERLIPDAVNVEGSDTDERKEEVFKAFSDGEIRVIVSKPTIAGFGLNWQHCAHQTFFPSHSYEQYYQAVRRSWRFGQNKTVTVDIISTEVQTGVLENLNRKSKAADEMFSNMINLVGAAKNPQPQPQPQSKQTRIPSWL